MGQRQQRGVFSFDLLVGTPSGTLNETREKVGLFASDMPTCQAVMNQLSPAVLRPEKEHEEQDDPPGPLHDSHSDAPAATASAGLVPTVRFLQAKDRATWRPQGMLVVRIERISKAARGHLAEILDEAVEIELASRGASSAGLGAGDALSDQLFRARQVGMRAIGLALGPLVAATSHGALEASDTRTLLYWAKAARERPVGLVLDASDAALPAHIDPTPLSAALFPSPPSRCAVAPTPPTAAVAPTPPTAAVAPTLPTAVAPTPRAAAVAPTPPTAAVAPTPLAAPTLPATAILAPRPPAPSPAHLAGASLSSPDDAWRTWTLALTAARGPQPLAAFERLFTQSYLPLANAIAAGLDDPRARAARDEFRRNFGHVYAEACPTFAVTGKRPRMVFDAPDVAARIARLHGARTTQLLLVDAMRYDLGEMVKANLARALGSRGSLTDEALLWSALPTTTPRQLYLLGHGSEGLREAPVSEREPEASRGRTVETIRRVKIGSRDVYKLDLPEARLREASTHALPALTAIAGTVADVIARHAATLAARTLLFVFGDHGFTVEPDGTTCQGGPSPEEVLVPGYAFLIGDVH